jgi:methyl-accepting chemotaxis protein
MPAQENKSVSLAAPVKKRFRSITNVFLFTFLGLVALVFIVNNGLNLYFNFNKEQNLIAFKQNSIAQNAAATVKEFINEKLRIIDQSAYVNDLITNPDRRELVMNKLMGRTPSFRQLLLVDSQGKKLQEASRLSSSMRIDLAAAEMNILLSTVKEKKNYISAVSFDSLTQEPIIRIAIPAKNVFGDVQGALIAEVNLKFMWDLVSSMKIGDNGLAYVVDKQGNLIAFGDISRVLARENLSKLNEVSEFVKNSDSTKDSNVEITKGIRNDGYVVSNYVPLISPNWAVIVELPVSEAYRSLFLELGILVLVMFGSVLCGTMLAVYLSKKITKPIIELTDVVRKIEKGDLGVQINVKSRDEIGELASGFNLMTQELKQLYANLEQKIKERTEKLDQKIAELEKFNKLTVDRELKMIELKKELADLKNKKE